jgi:homoserine O-acetyltransferase
MDALMPLASLPVQIAGRNRIWRRMVMDSIRQDPEWNGGEYQKQPGGLTWAAYMLILMGSSPLRYQKEAPTRDAADQLLDRLVKTQLQRLDANDFLYQVDSSRNYNPAPLLGKIQAPLVAINSADDQINPPELGILEAKVREVPRGRYVLLPISEETHGHGTHTYPAIWKDHLALLLEASKK